MTKSFDEVLTIDADGRISPRGPLTRAADEQIEKLYAWVIQLNPDGTGAACVATQGEPADLAGNEWTTKAGAPHGGRFREGSAVGLGVTVSEELVNGKTNGKTRVYWWSETIYLRPERVWDSGSDHSAELAEINETLTDLTGLLGSGAYRAGTPQRIKLNERISGLAARQAELSTETVQGAVRRRGADSLGHVPGDR